MRNLKDIRKYKFVFFLILVFFSMATSPTGVDMTDPKTPEITNPGVSSTKPKGLEATLNDINNNMGQMAEIMAKMFSKLDNSDSCPTGNRQSREKGKERARSRDNSPAVESEHSDCQDEPETKRNRSSEDEQDRLRVHACDEEDDIGNLLTEHPSPVNDHTNDEDLLQDLAKAFEEDDSTGSEINEKLAELANKRWTGKKLSPDKLRPVLDKYKQPANCSNISAITVNPEIWAQMKPYKKTGDLTLANMQQTLRKIAFANLQTANSLLALKTEGKVEESQTKPLLTNCVDSVALIGHLHNGLSTLRRSKIRPFLKSDYSTLCSNVEASSPLLFGDDLPKKLREAKETSRLSQVSSSAPKARNSSRSQNTRSYDNNHNSNNWQKSGYRSSKSPYKKDFRWVEQQKFRKKFQKNTEKTGK